jgi:hypothetical protein
MADHEGTLNVIQFNSADLTDYLTTSPVAESRLPTGMDHHMSDPEDHRVTVISADFLADRPEPVEITDLHGHEDDLTPDQEIAELRARIRDLEHQKRQTAAAEHAAGLNVNGRHIPRNTIAAQYVITDDPNLPGAWTDVPEVKPRCRVRVKAGAGPALVVVTTDGEMHLEAGARVDVDGYEGDEYAKVREEGEQRWK